MISRRDVLALTSLTEGAPTLVRRAADGRHAGMTLRGNAKYAVCDENGARLEPCEPLLNRSRSSLPEAAHRPK